MFKNKQTKVDIKINNKNFVIICMILKQLIKKFLDFLFKVTILLTI